MVHESLDGKLVRDRIPEIIRLDGKKPHTRTVMGGEKMRYLLAKLVEEAGEAQTSATMDELAEELTDVLEVVEALRLHTGVSREKLGEMLLKKREERGGFEKGIVLQGIDE